MAIEQFLDFGGVPGEAVGPGVRDLVAITSWELAMGRDDSAGPMHTPGLVLNKPVDSATPLLMTLCADGRVTPQARLVVRSVGQNAPRITIDMRDVRVESVRSRVDGSNDDAVEELRLSFSRIWFGAARVERGIASDDTNWFAWDLEANTPAT